MSTDLRVSPGQGSYERPALRLPDSGTVFLRRAERFRQLASRSQSMTGYLHLMAELAKAQEGARQVLYRPDTAMPDDPHLPIDLTALTSNPGWHTALNKILELLPAQAEPIAAALARLGKTATSDLDVMAQRMLDTFPSGIDPAFAPFLAAALQVHGVMMTEALTRILPQALPNTQRCPICGGLPVASVIETGGNLHGLRFLCCSLCTTQWNYPRIQCLTCASSQAVAYYGFEEQGDAIKAEACEDCKVYLKIMNREKDAAVDPIADDIATLGLDVKMADAGFSRYAANPFLVL